MDVVADIARLPGLAPGEAISGGIAAQAGSDACLLYRYTGQVLEVRAMDPLALEVPEALATLSTAQLQLNAVEDLEIALVKPVALNGSMQLLVFLRETLSQAGRLCTFNPFTLGIHHISATVPYSPNSISVSAPFCAGQGSSTEWEFAIVCFGLAGGRALVGNLTIGSGGSQLTALKTCTLGKHKCGVTDVCVLQRPDTSGRALIFFGLESGHAVALEYNPFNGGRATHVCTLSGGADLGPVTCVAGVALDDRRMALCSGHDSGSHSRAVPTASVYVVSLGPADNAQASADVAHIGTASMASASSDIDGDGGDDQQALAEGLLRSAQLVDLDIIHALDADEAAGRPPTLVLVALASTTVAEADFSPRDRIRSLGSRQAGTGATASGSEIVHGAFNAWVLDGQQPGLAAISQQGVVGSDAILGMHVSGRAMQLEVATARRLLVGSALADAAVEDSAGAAARCGVGLPPDISRYVPAAGQFAYPPAVRSALADQRQRMDGELFVDLLLQMAGVAGADSSRSVYPPRTQDELQALVERVGSSDLDDLKQHCIAYYLVLDGSAEPLVASHGGYEEQGADPTVDSAAAAEYARDALIPRHFEYLIRGYWLMDHAQVAAGMPYLADPSVVADWASKILSTAVAGGYHSEALLFLNSATGLMSPRLDELPSEAPAVMEALLHCGFTRAFEFQRLAAPVPDLRQVLLGQLFSFALSPSAHRSIVSQLAMLPFDAVEEEALATHCLRSDAPARERDFLALHYVNCGRYAEAIRLFRALAKEETGRYLDGEQRRKRDERLVMVRNLTMLLPEAQRGIIEELEALDEGAGEGPSATAAADKSRPSAQGAGPDPARSRPMDVDGMDHRRETGGTAGNDSGRAAAPLSVLLSASKSERQQRSVVGVHGAPQSPSHSLLRVLMRQMAAGKPHRVGASGRAPEAQASADAGASDKQGAAGAPAASGSRSTPMSGRANGAPAEVSPAAAGSPALVPRRVPFSGTPSTPRQSGPSKPANLADAGRTPGRRLLAHAALAESPVSAERVPGGFPALGSLARSPAEQERQSTAADADPPADIDAGPSDAGTSDAGTLQTEGDSSEPAPDAQPRGQRRARRKPAQTAAAAAADHAAAGQKSARQFERARRQTETQPPATRSRKRT